MTAPVNQFLPFATEPGARVRTYAEWLASDKRPLGYPSGVLLKEDLNTALRQATFVAAALSQLAADQTGDDVPDDGDIPAYEARLLLMIQNISAGIGLGAKKYVSASQTIAGGFYVVDASGGAVTLTLPPVTGTSRTVIQFEDATGRGDRYPWTVGRNGATIFGKAEDLIYNAAGYGFTLWYDGTTWKMD
jgi:hypothetical protein